MIESPELSGLLYKRRGGFGKIMPNAWQYRFFTLSKEGVLQYFDTEMPDTDALDSRARGRLDLKATTYDTTIESIEGAPTQFPIQIIIPNEETWKMCAYGKEDQQRWIKALEKFQHGPKGKPNNAITSYASDDELERTRKAAAESTRSPKPVATGPEPVIKPESKTPLTNKNADSAPVSQDPILDTKVRDLPPATAQGAAVPAKSIVTRQRRNSVKKRLKLAGAKSLIEQETAEMSLVILILNVCFYGVLKNPFLLWKFFYVVVANFVIYHTLALRGARVSKAVNQKVEVAQVTVVDQKEHKSENSEKVISEQVVAASTTIVEQGVDDKGLDEDTEVIPVDQKPIPGCTYVKSEGDPRQAPVHTWSTVDHRQFNVRVGPNYDRYKKKAPSGHPIYEPFAVDVFCAKSRVDHVAQRFLLPDMNNIQTNNKYVPPIFVIQIQIPSEPPASFFSSSEDGPGWAVVMYFKITEDACEQLKNLSTASPAVKLFAQWCEKAENDPLWRGRFKVICSCSNLSEIGVPSAIEAYNAKPVLIRRTGSIFRGPSYLEMNIHVHKFANLAKQSIFLLSSRCSQLYMQIGFVIEGRDDSELPETLFACVGINRPQEDQAEFIFDDN